MTDAPDEYADDTYRWWHSSTPSPELLSAIGDGWIPASSGRAVDLGCGLGTEANHLQSLGWEVAGVDLSPVALDMARRTHPHVSYLLADLRMLPFRSGEFDLAVDRGCFHYLPPGDRSAYAASVGRVLRPGGRLLLRASLRSAGIPNDIDESVVRSSFQGWHIDRMERIEAPSDTRTMLMLEARLRRL
ncbi:MAG TPA: class I SAM-dependent methyltransferase [Acidimicrobiales bacterium]|nr:class I SAM-dependent methyltransferase [Acidimicrobiales bacterium]